MSKRKSRKKGTEKQTELNPYKILEVAETATDREIRKAYLQQVRLASPERDPEGFKKVRRAYGILKDISHRKKLDLSIFRTVSDIKVDTVVSDDFKELFSERIFQILISSSDFYIENFNKFSRNIDKEIEGLK